MRIHTQSWPHPCIWMVTKKFRLGLHLTREPLFSERFGNCKCWRFLGLQLHYRPVLSGVSSPEER